MLHEEPCFTSNKADAVVKSYQVHMNPRYVKYIIKYIPYIHSEITIARLLDH